MLKKSMSIILALLLALAAPIPALAAEGEAAPPQAVTEEAPPAELPPAEEAFAEPAPAEEPPADIPLPDSGTMTIEAPADEAAALTGTETVPEEPVPAAAEQGVTVTVAGSVDQIENITYLSPDNARCYTVDGNGIRCNTPDGVVWVSQSGFPLQFTVAPGTELAVYMNTAYDVTVDNGAVSENEFYSFPTGAGELISFRRVAVQAPATGTVTITAAAAGSTAPTQIPFTFYNEDWDGGVIVGGGSTGDGQYAWAVADTVISGGTFEVWTGPGYEIQVVEGGSILETRAPAGPGAAFVPAGSTSYVLYVDLGAERLAIAAVRQGESYEPVAQAAAGGPVLAVSGAVEAVESIRGVDVNGRACTVRQDGLYYDGETVPTDGIPSEVSMQAGSALDVELAPGYAIRVSGGSDTGETLAVREQQESYDAGGGLTGWRTTGLEFWSHSFGVQLPASGTVTVEVVPTGTALPAAIPLSIADLDEASAQGLFSGLRLASECPAAGPAQVMLEVQKDCTVNVLSGGSVRSAEEQENGLLLVTVDVPLDSQGLVMTVAAQGMTATGVFRDVPDSSWYKPLVERAYASGIVSGTGDGVFSPDVFATRAQTVTMIYRQAGSPKIAGSVSFVDVSEGYYRDAVAWGAYVGAVNGVSSTSFAPDDAVTREQLAVILYRMAGQPTAFTGGHLAGYSDGGAVSAYATTAMEWALDYGILTGDGNGFVRPGSPATRAEVCAMLLRYQELVGLYPTDPAKLPQTEQTENAQTQTAAFQEQAVSQNVTHAARNLDNPKLIKPKRTDVDPGVYDNGTDHDKFMQQWSETFWDLDRSGEDILWCHEWGTRMRSGPGMGYDVVYTIGNAYEVSRLGPDENGWTPVVYHEYDWDGFTGWDHTGYVPTASLTKTKPDSPQVADFSSGPALDAWCDHCGRQTGEFLHEYSGAFYHEAYDPVINGSTYTHTLRGGGKVIIHDVVPEGLRSVEVSAYEQDVSLTVFVYVQFGYGIRCPGYDGGYGLSPDGDNIHCGLYYTLELVPGEDVEMTMVSGRDAPRVLKATITDPLGGSRTGDGASRFVFLDENGSLASYHMAENFFNLKSGYKLKSLSPYASVGRVENNELHYFSVENLPEDVDQIWFEVVRG